MRRRDVSGEDSGEDAEEEAEEGEDSGEDAEEEAEEGAVTSVTEEGNRALLQSRSLLDVKVLMRRRDVSGLILWTFGSRFSSLLLPQFLPAGEDSGEDAEEEAEE
eukprot:s8218_g1.t1